MPVQIRCPQCQTKFNLSDQTRGKKVRCKVCQEILLVPADEPAEVAEAFDDDIQSSAEPNARRRRPEVLLPRLELEDERPSVSRKRKEPRDTPSGVSTGLIIGGSIVALLLVMAVAGGAMWMFASRGTPPGVGPGPALMPGQAPDGMAQADPPAGMGAVGPTLRYRWQGAPAVYAVSVALHGDNEFEVHQGYCVVNAQPGPRAQAPPVERKGTGTGFVVHADGYLITCAHVVEDATRIDVTIGGRVFPGTVRAIDLDQDLALVHIPTNGLTTVPLGNSDAAELGAEVWAVGFPLASVLGDNIKTTKGTLSGINQKNGRKVFQVDAPINPGNSGGPLFDASGGVVGVNKSKLAGEAVSNVGFATPSGEAARMLRGKGVAFATADAGAKLDGPALIRQVAPAVALITVTIGPGGNSDTYNLSFSTNLAKSQQPRRPGVPFEPGVPQQTFGGQKGGVKTDTAGTILEAPQNDVQLPAILGGVGRFLIEPFPTGGQPSWEKTATWIISENSGRLPFGMPGFPRGGRPPFVPGPPGFGPPGMNQEKKQPAVERSTYSRGAVAGDNLTIDKRFELKADPVGGMAGFSLSGTKQIVFDTKAGLPRSLAFEGTLVETMGNNTSRVPLTVRYRLVEGADRDKILDPTLTDEQLTTALADVAGADGFRRSQALHQLVNVRAVNRKDEATRTLVGVIENAKSDFFLRKGCLEALAIWGTAESVPTLLGFVDDENVFLRGASIVALGNIKDERAIEPVARRLETQGDRTVACNALKSIGGKAEKTVLSYLTSKDWGVQICACEILQVIGTKESTDALTKASRDSNGLVALEAKKALAGIAKR